jgi:hypothetical protein
MQTDDLRGRFGNALVAVAATDMALTEDRRLATLSEAEGLLLNAHDALLQNGQGKTKHRRHAVSGLVRLYETWEKPDQLSEWQAKLAELDNSEEAKLKAEEFDSPAKAEPAGQVESPSR